MKKLLGIAVFLLLLYGILLVSAEGARSAANHFNLGRRIGLYGLITLGAGLLIITGGIDLSIGSVVGLSATVLAMLVVDYRQSFTTAILLVLLLGAVIGLVNGLLVTRLRVQAFVVTLCGLFIYRGAARWLAGDHVKGLGQLATSGKVGKIVTPGPRFTEYHLAEKLLYSGGWFEKWLAGWDPTQYVPVSLIYFLVLAGVAAVFLHWSVYGRYFYAIGSNERAARYSGIATDRYKVLAYVLCSTLAAFFGVLYLMQEKSAQPSSTGNFLELYAIAGAVLGGCSLSGGEGNVLGFIIGTSILVLLPNLANMLGIPSALEYTVIGGALLIGAVIDELLKRRASQTR
jgi:ribose transport system permease protein